jgi:GNAT superfamily N-acetyltransferase
MNAHADTEAMETATSAPDLTGLTVLREPRPGDLGRIVEMHGQIEAPDFGLNSDFEAMVAKAVGRAAAAGFPGEGESIRLLIDAEGELRGSTALTRENQSEAWLRWVLLDHGIRGRGLGRWLIEGAVADARAFGYDRVVFETFSDLKVAAAIYRSVGFRVVSEDRSPRWGRTDVNFQRYLLDL